MFGILFCVAQFTIAMKTTVFVIIRYSSCCWIGLASGGGSWDVRVKGNLTRRADNGLINTSPISTMPPIVRLQHGCNHTIQIPGKASNSPAKVTPISE